MEKLEGKIICNYQNIFIGTMSPIPDM
jgi:hypothetical protein